MTGEGGMEWQHRLLEELVYERVKLHVDFLDLIDFEHDLCDSIARVLQASGTEPGQEETVARELVDQAWRRLEQEWRRERAASSLLCPLCEAPFECPSPEGPRGRVASD